MHDPLPVKGYSPQSQAKIDQVNKAKQIEERVMRYLDELAELEYTDKRAVAIARTNVQDAFMWSVRSIMQPSRISLPEDSIE